MSDAVKFDPNALDDEGRRMPPLSEGEAATLLGFLDYQRATFDWKSRDLSTEQLRRKLTHPSQMTLGGLMKHLAIVEDDWISKTATGGQLPQVWNELGITREDDWEWTSALQDSGDDLRSIWSAAVDRSRAAVDALLGNDPSGALSTTHAAWGGEADVSLRWILVHMIEEYARHNGHADLLREVIDGQTGE